VRFNERAGLDATQVQDLRGRTGLSIPGGGKTVFGGLGGIVALVLALVLGGRAIGGGGNSPFGGLDGQTVTPDAATPQCQTGADANAREDCRIVAVVNSVQAYWNQALPAEGHAYQPADTTFFDGQVDTGCGTASSATGPFYCPVDDLVYIDLGFYDQLRSQFGAQGGPFAEAYVIAHEYGHHVQDLLGLTQRVGRDSGPQSTSMRLELQADCLAGVWAAHASSTTDASGQPLIVGLTDADIRDGLDAAAAVGDDRIQQSMQGRVNPESFTHGTAEQRQRWFMSGFRGANIGSCDTWSGNV